MDEMTKATESVLALQQGLAASALVGKTVQYTLADGTTAPGPADSASFGVASSAEPTVRVGGKDIPLSSITTVGTPALTPPHRRFPCGSTERSHHAQVPVLQHQRHACQPDDDGRRRQQHRQRQHHRLQVVLGDVRGHPQPDAAGRLGAAEPARRLQPGPGRPRCPAGRHHHQLHPGRGRDHRSLDRPDAAGRRLLRRQQGRRRRLHPQRLVRLRRRRQPGQRRRRPGPGLDGAERQRRHQGPARARSPCRSARRCRRSRRPPRATPATCPRTSPSARSARPSSTCTTTRATRARSPRRTRRSTPRTGASRSTTASTPRSPARWTSVARRPAPRPPR